MQIGSMQARAPTCRFQRPAPACLSGRKRGPRPRAAKLAGQHSMVVSSAEGQGSYRTSEVAAPINDAHRGPTGVLKVRRTYLC